MKSLSGVVKDQRTKSIGKLADVIRNLAMKNDSLLDLVCFEHYFDDKLQKYKISHLRLKFTFAQIM